MLLQEHTKHTWLRNRTRFPFHISIRIWNSVRVFFPGFSCRKASKRKNHLPCIADISFGIYSLVCERTTWMNKFDTAKLETLARTKGDLHQF